MVHYRTTVSLQERSLVVLGEQWKYFHNLIGGFSEFFFLLCVYFDAVLHLTISVPLSSSIKKGTLDPSNFDEDVFDQYIAK